MKKILSFLLIMSIVCSLSIVSFADKNIKEQDEAFSRLTDKANLLTSAEETSIKRTLDDLSDYHGVDICIRTVKDSKGKSVEDYADDFYDNHYGENGVLLVIYKDNRDWYISTCGTGIEAFTDYGIEFIGEQIVPYLKEGNYMSAFIEFTNQVDLIYSMFEQGKPFDKVKENEDKGLNIFKAILIALAVGIIVAFSIVSYQKKSLTTVSRRLEATEYTKDGSFILTESRDMYLYFTVTKIPKLKEQEGGSSTHMSSGGMIHGGGGGKF